MRFRGLLRRGLLPTDTLLLRRGLFRTFLKRINQRTRTRCTKRFIIARLVELLRKRTHMLGRIFAGKKHMHGINHARTQGVMPKLHAVAILGIIFKQRIRPRRPAIVLVNRKRRGSSGVSPYRRTAR